MPNTTYRSAVLKVVNGPTVTWIEPPAHVCGFKNESLIVVANSTKAVRKVIYRDGSRQIGVDKSGPGGVFSVVWHTRGLKKGVHRVTATAVDASGRKAAAGRQFRVCK